MTQKSTQNNNINPPEGQTRLSPLQRQILKRWQKKNREGVSQEVKDRLSLHFAGEVLFNEPMSRHTAMKTGGPADVFLKPRSGQDVHFAVKLAHENNIPCYFHGAGANTLVKDGGVRGFVISACDVLKDYEVVSQEDEHIDIRADAGLNFNRLIHVAKELGAADLAPFIGIPGSVGGLVAMNAGTHVKEIKETVRSVTVLTKEGEEKTIPRENLVFEYRSLKMPSSHFILGALFRLTELVSPEEVSQMIRQYQKRRAETQPLEYPNLGSIFRNPQPSRPGEVVAPAGRLIEEAGLKNVRVGGARISPKHANFIVNENNATARDILSLIHLIRDKVRQGCGVVLETEIKIIGEDK